MRILQINSAVNFGGGERHFLDLGRGLTARGNVVFAAVKPTAEWRQELNFAAPNNIFLLPLRNALDGWSAHSLAQVIIENNIEIVHAHLARDYAIAALAVRLSRANARLVLTRHVLFPINLSYKFLLPRNTTFIAVSKAVQNGLLNQKIVPSAQIRLVYNGVDIAAIDNAERDFDRDSLLERLGLPSSRKFVGIVGEITAHKGQIDFVRAARLVADKCPDVDFLIVGQDGSTHKQHQIRLEKLIAELNLTERVHLLGWQKDAVSILFLFDVFVSAARVEPFGLTIAEAMAAGLPIVAAASEGAREILSDEETGLIVPISDQQAMARQVLYLLENQKVSETISANARADARKRFDSARMIVETESVYRAEF